MCGCRGIGIKTGNAPVQVFTRLLRPSRPARRKGLSMDKVISFLVPAFIGLCSSPAAAAEFCRYASERSASIDAVGATRLVIEAGAGDLLVRGGNNLRTVEATGRVCAFKEAALAQVQITARREGTTLYVTTAMPETSGRFSWLDTTLDLAVTLPVSLSIEVKDGGGDLSIARVRSAKIDDGAGHIKVGQIAGDLAVSDGAGNMIIDQIVGSVTIERDDAGDIHIEDVRRDVKVLLDGSGGLQIERVAGSVHIGQDSSGDLGIREVKGNVRVDSDSSGDIRVVQVGGNFIVEADSTGNISHDRVEGSVRMPPDRDRDQ
jgi:hypothetical protein